MKIDIKKLREVGEDATPGNWDYSDHYVEKELPDIATREEIKNSLIAELFTENPMYGDSSSDTLFIATARNNWENLLNALEEAKEIIKSVATIEMMHAISNPSSEDEPTATVWVQKYFGEEK